MGVTSLQYPYVAEWAWQSLQRGIATAIAPSPIAAWINPGMSRDLSGLAATDLFASVALLDEDTTSHLLERSIESMMLVQFSVGGFVSAVAGPTGEIAKPLRVARQYQAALDGTTIPLYAYAIPAGAVDTSTRVGSVFLTFQSIRLLPSEPGTERNIIQAVATIRAIATA